MTSMHMPGFFPKTYGDFSEHVKFVMNKIELIGALVITSILGLILGCGKEKINRETSFRKEEYIRIDTIVIFNPETGREEMKFIEHKE